MVPNGWEVRELNEICSKTISYGIVQTGPEVANGIPCIRVVDLSKKHMNTSDMIKTSEKIHQSYKKTILEKDELVMALRGEIGLVRIIEDDLSGINITRGIARLAPKKNWVIPDFLLWAMRSYEVKKDLSRKSGGSALQEISLTALRKVKITLPPLPEQQKIAKILATWDKAIDTTERLIDNSKQQKKALMQQLLTGKKRLLDDNGKPFEGEWEEVQLADLGSTFNGLTGKTKVDFGYGEKYIPYMNIFKNTFIDSNELDFVNIQANEKQSTVQFGDIFFTTSSETPEEVGMSSVFISDTQENIYLNSFCFGFRLQSLEIVSPHFIGYILRSSKIRRKISVLAQGSTRFNISKRQLVKTAIPLPSLKEQQKIAAVLTTADKEIELLEQQLADLQQEKKALMQVLLTGKKRVVVGEVI